MSNRLYLDLHIIQTMPPSNVNRDDTGSPKDALYGGARRARVSSQSWKRATRRHLLSELSPEDRSLRTERLQEAITEYLYAGGSEDDEHLAMAKALARGAVATLTESWKPSNRERTAYTLFLQRGGIEQVATALREEWETLTRIVEGTRGKSEQKILTKRQKDEDKKAEKEGKAPKRAQLTAADHDAVSDEVTKQLKERLDSTGLWDFLEAGKPHPPEVALFGRMVADRTEFNVDGSVQVAHALSTHDTKVEFDYFTTIDDFEPNSGNQAPEPGSPHHGPATMIGHVEFNSATYYRFATIAVHQLHANLGGADAVAADTAKVVKAFIRSFTVSIPSGHQNSFGHSTRPHLLVVTARGDGPVNLVTAFEKPIWVTDGRAAASMVELANEHKAIENSWGSPAERVFATYVAKDDKTQGSLTEAFGASLPFGELLGEVEAYTDATLRGDA